MVDDHFVISRLPGKVAQGVLNFLLLAGEGFIDGFYQSVAHPHMNFSKYGYRSIYNSVKRLEQRGLVETKREGKRLKVVLTKDGQRYAELIATLDLAIKKPKKWDGKWRFMIFDIPETHKIVREILRNRIKELGFAQVQKSVFVTPWPCKDVVEKIQNAYQATDFIRYIEANSFDGENLARVHFHIKTR